MTIPVTPSKEMPLVRGTKNKIYMWFEQEDGTEGTYKEMADDAILEKAYQIIRERLFFGVI